MKRTKPNTVKKADGILTSDWHIREDTPQCRTDNFWQTFWQKVAFVSDLQKQHDCDIYHGGDLLDGWKVSPFLLTTAIRNMPDRFYSVIGNHDLPQNNIIFKEKSGFETLEAAGAVKFIRFGYWNDKPKEQDYIDIKGRKLYVWHHFVYSVTTKEFWMKQGNMAQKILKENPQYDVILTGDNHTPFVEEYHGRLLINPGSLTRQDASQKEFRPRVYLYYADTNTVEPVYIPIDKQAVSDEHLREQEKRDERIQSFVKSLDTNWETGIVFENNLREFERANTVRKSVMQIVYKSIDPDA